MQKLAQQNTPKIIDLLTERLTFERAGVRLYDSIIDKMRASTDPNIERMLDDMEENRDEEKAHEEWLEDQIRKLGGDTDSETEMSRLVEIESQGLERVILDGDPDIAHLFHALLNAELVDNVGWQLLVELADEFDDREAKRAFKRFLHEEEEHLEFVHKAVQKFIEQGVLGGRQVGMPTSP